MLMTILAIAIGLIVILTCILWIYSPGKSTAYLNESGKPLLGSISEKIYVNINGMMQGMIIKSKDETHPVLLYLHGGLPDYFLTRSTQNKDMLPLVNIGLF